MDPEGETGRRQAFKSRDPIRAVVQGMHIVSVSSPRDESRHDALVIHYVDIVQPEAGGGFRFESIRSYADQTAMQQVADHGLVLCSLYLLPMPMLGYLEGIRCILYILLHA
jgi:hypothetical protein